LEIDVWKHDLKFWNSTNLHLGDSNRVVTIFAQRLKIAPTLYSLPILAEGCHPRLEDNALSELQVLNGDCSYRLILGQEEQGYLKR
jgi:hypothetical protein